MRKQNNRPVVIPLGEPMVKLAAFVVVLAIVVGIAHWCGWMGG